MWDIGWKNIAGGLILLLDIIVFADLVRAEFACARAGRSATKHRQLPTSEDDPTWSRYREATWRRACPLRGLSRR